MAYIIKINRTYLAEWHPHLWSGFSVFQQQAQRFNSEAEAEKVKASLLDPTMYRDFDEGDVEIIEIDKKKDVLGEMIKKIDPDSLAKTRDEMLKEAEEYDKKHQ